MKLASLDVDLQKHCAIGNPPPDAEIREMVRRGAAVLVWGPLVIPQIHAHSMEELQKIVAYFENVAAAQCFGCFMRGQTRDYYLEDELTVVPAAYRDPKYRLK